VTALTNNDITEYKGMDNI